MRTEARRCASRSRVFSRQLMPALRTGSKLRPVLMTLSVAGVLAGSATAAFSATTRSEHGGVLGFSGGIQAQTTLKPSTCTAGPGDSIAIALANVGGWSSLYLTASTPRPGQRGVAKVSLQGTGHRDNAYAIAVWDWTKKAAGGAGFPLRITANGTDGAMNVKLPLVTVDDSSSFPAVVLTLSWSAGTCAR
jgi:hypothetical protein